jgi:hypothetical protein
MSLTNLNKHQFMIWKTFQINSLSLILGMTFALFFTAIAKAETTENKVFPLLIVGDPFSDTDTIIIPVPSSETNPFPEPFIPSPQRKTLAEILVITPTTFFPIFTPSESISTIPRNSPTQTGKQYRVLIIPNDENQAVMVRSLHPETITTDYYGRKVLQIGIFDNRENANSTLSKLKKIGLYGLISPI